jgi:hypothetical protein
VHGERGGGERDTVKEGERCEGRGKGRENVWERVIGRERAKGRGREIGRDGVQRSKGDGEQSIKLK